MNEMFKKKTTWAGIALVFTGVGTILADDDKTRGIQIILEGLALIFLRSAIAKG